MDIILWFPFFCPCRMACACTACTVYDMDIMNVVLVVCMFYHSICLCIKLSFSRCCSRRASGRLHIVYKVQSQNNHIRCRCARNTAQSHSRAWKRIYEAPLNCVSFSFDFICCPYHVVRVSCITFLLVCRVCNKKRSTNFKLMKRRAKKK